MGQSSRPELTREQREQVRELLGALLETPVPDPAGWLREQGRGDEAVHAEVLSLLAEAQETRDFLAAPAELPGDSGFHSEPHIPAQIDEYTIKSKIASGGMGTVYLAYQENPRRVVALKVMRAGLTSDAIRRRFEYESQILAHLRHPNIAQIYDAGSYEGPAGEQLPFFAMEYVPNARTLTEYAKEKRLGTRERLALFLRVCEAVSHGHEKGIIHRDLKPANILVDSSGQPKIIDFGVARSTDSDVALATLATGVGELIGTLQYMSPEQCDADPHDLDTRSDVYALGVILYELLCERLPYDVAGVSKLNAAAVIKGEAPTRLSTIDRTLRGDIETIALKALEKDRDRRYRSALDLAGDIRRYLNDQPIEARPPSVTYQVRMFARRHKGVFSAFAAVLMALVIGFIFTQTAWASERRQRQAAESARLSMLAMAQIAFDFIDEVPVRHAREALEDTVAALESWVAISETGSQDSTLIQSDLALGHRQLAKLLGGPRGPNLGRREDALVHARRALDLNQAVTTTQPHDAANMADVARDHLYIGDLLDDDDERLRSYELALQVSQTLLDADRRSDEARRLVAMTTLKFGDVLLKRGDLPGARAQFDRSMRLRRERATDRPEDETAQRDLGTAYGRFGRLLLVEGDLEGGLREYERLLSHRIRTAERLPSSRRVRRDILVAHELVADADIKLGRYEAASEHLQTATGMAAVISQEEPDDDRIRRDRSRTLYSYAWCLAELGDRASALAALDEWDELGPQTSSSTDLQQQVTELREELRAAAEAK